MTFDRDLFISYAHIDNLPLTPEQQGWVSRFHSALEAMLSMRLGKSANIWRDEKLTGNDIFADEIIAQFSKTALLLTVLSPRYVKSDWCRRELEEFCKAAERSIGLVVENKSRVLKIVKFPVESEDVLPAIVRGMLGYQFFTLGERQTPMELDPAYGQDLAQKFNVRIAVLAWDIAQLVRNLDTAIGGAVRVPMSVGAKATVYLAESSYDRREAREALAAELRLHGYTILPDRELPRNETDYLAEVIRILEQCQLSIHLIGNSYGAVLDGVSEKSTVVLQNECAIERSRAAGLPRLIWLPEGTKASNSEQERFIQVLHSDAGTQFGADLITADLESFKAAVLAALKKLDNPPPASPAASGESRAKLVYLICDERDRPATIPLRKFLQVHGCEVRIPVFEGDAATVRQANQDQMTQCDAAIIFYGWGEEAWKRTVENELRKIKAYRRDNPLPPPYTYLAPPATRDKSELLELMEENLIDGVSAFSEAAVEPFLKKLPPTG
jgi:hypothetical protein